MSTPTATARRLFPAEKWYPPDTFIFIYHPDILPRLSVSSDDLHDVSPCRRRCLFDTVLDTRSRIPLPIRGVAHGMCLHSTADSKGIAKC